MIEQYIYSRSKKKFINGRGEQINLGFGFMAVTPGLKEKDKEDLLLFCGQYRNKDVKDASGQLVPMGCKSTLRSGGAAVLQHNCYMTIEQRGTHVAHGFLIPWDSPALVQPRGWFGADFWRTDPNLESPGDGETGKGILLDGVEQLPGQPLQLWPLAQVMEQLQINEQGFSAVLRACFDAVCGQQQVQIAFDFGMPQAEQLQKQVLCWIYQCLPFSLRRKMGFDAVCTDATAVRQYQLTLVPKDTIQIVGQKAYIRRSSLTAVGNHFMFAQGQLFHVAASNKMEWTGGDSLFARWMDSMVHQLWQTQGDVQPLLDKLDQVYALFDRLMAEVPPESACDRDLFDAICWHYLADGNGKVEQAPHIPQIDDCVECTPEEVRRCQLALLALPGQRAAEEVGLSVLADLRERIGEQDDAGRDEMLALLEVAGRGPERVAEKALRIGQALLAHEIVHGTGRPEGLLEKYKQAFQGERYVSLVEHGLVGPCGPGKQGAEACSPVVDAWVRRWLEPCDSLTQLSDSCKKCLYALPEISEQATETLYKALTECINQLVSAQSYRITLEEMCTLIDRMSQLKSDHRAQRLHKIDQGLLAYMRKRYSQSNPQASLGELETLWRAFQPYMHDEYMRENWNGLLKERGEKLAIGDCKKGFHPDLYQQDSLERLNRLDQALAGQPDARRVMQLLYHGSLQAMEENPVPFMNGVWMRQQATALRSVVAEEDKKLLLLWDALGNFTTAPQQDVQAMTAACAQLDEKGKAEFRRRLPQMYLAGHLPKLSTGFGMLLLHTCPQKETGRLFLRQWVAQRGAEGVKDLVNWAQKCPRFMVKEGRKTSDLVYMLELLAEDDGIWQQLEAGVTKEKQSVILWLMGFCKKMRKQEDLGSKAEAHLQQQLMGQLTKLHQDQKWFKPKKYHKEFIKNSSQSKEKEKWRR